LSAVIDLRAYVDPSRAPTLVLIDMQQEYVASERLLSLAQAEGALANCRAALSHARTLGLPVAFFRWTGRSPFFNGATRFSRWIEDFQPTGSDMVFERSRPSCFASESFCDVMSHGGGNLVLAGFAGESACLSTAIEAFHRGHRFTFLSDASASHPLESAGGGEVHDIVSKVIGLYGDVMPTRSWIAATSRRIKRAEHESVGR
jgi:nicotinamidase-related amidase